MVDELRAALALATDEELSGLTDLLFRPKFNPLDYLQQPEVLALRAGDRDHWIDELAQRFRFLAADGVTVLTRKTDRMSYRMILIQVCRHLKLSYSSAMSTTDLEAEIFLLLVHRSGQAGSGYTELPYAKLPHAKLPHASVVLKGGGALAVTTVMTPLVKRAARKSLVKQGLAVAAQHGLQKGLGYGVVRSAAALVGPAMWTWFLADLGWRSISTNYGRVIPMVFAIAQIRLTRGLD